MSNEHNRLQLYWRGKFDEDKQIIPEPRILLFDKGKSCSKQLEDNNVQLSLGGRVESQNAYGKYFDNMIIHGDNLLALKSLTSMGYAGKVKCVYIDPPYNTGSAFEHYDDNLEHSTWLNLMKPRLELLKNLMRDDGSIWISIDADESHYLKVLCDEIFGRRNFIDEVVWQRAYSPINLKKTLSRSHPTSM